MKRTSRDNGTMQSSNEDVETVGSWLGQNTPLFFEDEWI